MELRFPAPKAVEGGARRPLGSRSPGSLPPPAGAPVRMLSGRAGVSSLLGVLSLLGIVVRTAEALPGGFGSTVPRRP